MYAWCVLLSILFLSCNKQERSTSVHYLQRVDSLLLLNNIEVAKRTLDSIHVLFPQEVEERKKALLKKYEIEELELERNFIFYDSIIRVKQTVIDSIEHFFVVKADSFYRGERVYEHFMQARMFPKTSLKLDVTEKGTLNMSSIYLGNFPLKYTTMLISSKGVFIQLEEQSSRLYTFRDGDTYWEIVNYNEKNVQDALSFINQFKQETIEITLQGQKKYSFILNNEDKNRIISTWYYATLLQEYNFAKTQHNIINSKIARLREKNKK